ncbi:MAG: hypothetical protein ACLPN5_02095 [Roseiarcus sp.]
MGDALLALRRERESDAGATARLRRELAEGLAQAERGEYSSRGIEDIVASVLGEAGA